MPSAKTEAVANANAHLTNAGLPSVDDLAAALQRCLNFIEHSEANKGTAATAAEWDANVEFFRKTVGHVGIGRSYLNKAAVDLTAVRAILSRLA